MNNQDKLGIIYPPEEQKVTIDKTAQFVAINGDELEETIIKREGTSTKFNFLKPENPYHAYYKFCVQHFLKQLSKNDPTVTLKPPQAPTPETVVRNRILQQKFLTRKRKTSILDRAIPQSDPLPILYNLEIPNSITALELDIIKLTALTVAKNGLDFLGVLAGRESRNPRFDFLKIGHKHFSFYSKLIEVYKLVLNPTQETIQKLRFFAALENKTKILDIIYSKKAWVSHQQEKKEREARVQKDEVEAQKKIDWHDFEIVETIEFFNDDDDDDNDTMDGNIRTGYTQIVVGAEKEDGEGEKTDNDDDDDDDDMDLGDDDEEEISTFEVLSDEKKEGNNNVVKFGDAQIFSKNNNNQSEEEEESEEEESEGKRVVEQYERRKRIIPSKKVDEYVRDPVTGALLNKDEASEHMKRQFIDQQYKINKKKELEKFKSTNVADNAQITTYLTDFVKSRSDLLLSGKEQQKKKQAGGGEGRAGMDQTGEGGKGSSAQPNYLWDGRKKTAKFAPKAHQAAEEKMKERKMEEKKKLELPPAPKMMNLPPPPRSVSNELHESIQLRAQRAALAAAQAHGGVMNNLLPPPPQQQQQQQQSVFGQPLPSTLGMGSGFGMGQLGGQANQLHSQHQTQLTGDKQQLRDFRPETRLEEQPVQKKRKTGLLPESEWLSKYGTGTVSINVIVPDDSTTTNLKGQTIKIDTIRMEEKVFEIERKISEEIGIKRSQIRLTSFGIGFLKPSKTLAFYNFSKSHTLELVLKKKRR